MELLHQQVHHAKFGDGEIVQQAETCVTVAFTAPFEEKHFLYPDAFAAFLTLCDPVQPGTDPSRVSTACHSKAGRSGLKEKKRCRKTRHRPENICPGPQSRIKTPPLHRWDSAEAAFSLIVLIARLPGRVSRLRQAALFSPGAGADALPAPHRPARPGYRPALRPGYPSGNERRSKVWKMQ